MFRFGLCFFVLLSLPLQMVFFLDFFICSPFWLNRSSCRISSPSFEFASLTWLDLTRFTFLFVFFLWFFLVDFELRFNTYLWLIFRNAFAQFTISRDISVSYRLNMEESRFCGTINVIRIFLNFSLRSNSILHTAPHAQIKSLNKPNNGC